MNKVLLFIAVFLAVGGYMIAQNLGTDFDDSHEKKVFIKEFAKWVWETGKKAKTITGYVIHEDWLPKKEAGKNHTNSTNETTQKSMVLS